MELDEKSYLATLAPLPHLRSSSILKPAEKLKLVQRSLVWALGIRYLEPKGQGFLAVFVVARWQVLWK